MPLSPRANCDSGDLGLRLGAAPQKRAPPPGPHRTKEGSTPEKAGQIIVVAVRNWTASRAAKLSCDNFPRKLITSNATRMDSFSSPKRARRFRETDDIEDGVASAEMDSSSHTFPSPTLPPSPSPSPPPADVSGHSLTQFSVINSSLGISSTAL